MFLSACFQGVCLLTRLKCVCAIAAAVAGFVLSLVRGGKQMATTKNASKKKEVVLPQSFKAGNKVLLSSSINRKGLWSEQRNRRESCTGGKTHELSAEEHIQMPKTWRSFGYVCVSLYGQRLWGTKQITLHFPNILSSGIPDPQGICSTVS